MDDLAERLEGVSGRRVERDVARLDLRALAGRQVDEAHQRLLQVGVHLVGLVGQRLVVGLRRPPEQVAGVHAVVGAVERPRQLVRLEAAGHGDEQMGERDGCAAEALDAVVPPVPGLQPELAVGAPAGVPPHVGEQAGELVADHEHAARARLDQDGEALDGGVAHVEPGGDEGWRNLGFPRLVRRRHGRP